MEISIMALIALVAGGFAFLKPKMIKKSGYSGVKALGGVLAVFGLLVMGGVIAQDDLPEFLDWGTVGQSEALSVSPGSAGATGTVYQCDSTTTPDLDINAYDIENPNTAVTEATNLYRKSGSTAWSTFTQGTAITGLEVGESYEVLMGVTTSDFTDNAYGEYMVVGPLACKESITMDKGVYNDEVETSISATFYDNNHDASAQTFTAGQVKDVYLKFEAGSDEVFGNPFIADSNLGDNGAHRAKYPNVLCMDLNSTAWDKPQKVSYGGVELNRVSTPLRHTPVSTDITYCYEAPVITDDGQEIVVRLDADDSSAPSNDDTAYIYAGNFYVTEDGDVAWGIENEEGTAVGTDAADSLVLDFTA